MFGDVEKVEFLCLGNGFDFALYELSCCEIDCVISHSYPILSFILCIVSRMCKEGEQVLNRSIEMDSIATPKTTETMNLSDNASLGQTTLEATSERSDSNEPESNALSTSDDIRTEEARRPRNASPQSQPIRRSTRDPTAPSLEKKEVQALLLKIRSNHPDTVVLKIKHHLDADVNEVVLTAIVEALRKNTVCEVSDNKNNIACY